MMRVQDTGLFYNSVEEYLERHPYPKRLKSLFFYCIYVHIYYMIFILKDDNE